MAVKVGELKNLASFCRKLEWGKGGKGGQRFENIIMLLL
jgi:hypothetical protein